MLGIRNNLIFGVIGKVIALIFRTLFKILKTFHVLPMFVVGITGVILYFTGTFENKTVLIVFDVVLGLSGMYAIWATVSGISKIGKKKNKEKKKKEKRGKVGIMGGVKDNGEQLQVPIAMDGGQVQYAPQPVYVQPQPIVQPVVQQVVQQPQPVQVRYYEVKQNPSLVMAEYADRYELYKKTSGGLLKIRTDYKKDI